MRNFLEGKGLFSTPHNTIVQSHLVIILSPILGYKFDFVYL